MLSVKLCRSLPRIAATIRRLPVAHACLPGQPNKSSACIDASTRRAKVRNETHQTVSGGEQTGCCSCTPTQRLMAACTWGSWYGHQRVAGRCQVLASVRCRPVRPGPRPGALVRIGSFRWPGTTPPPRAVRVGVSVSGFRQGRAIGRRRFTLPRTASCLWRLLRRSSKLPLQAKYRETGPVV